MVPSTNATTAVAETEVIGTSVELSRDDHVHNLPTDQTLGFQPTGELFVEVTDVLESLHETVSVLLPGRHRRIRRRRVRLPR